MANISVSAQSGSVTPSQVQFPKSSPVRIEKSSKPIPAYYQSPKRSEQLSKANGKTANSARSIWETGTRREVGRLLQWLYSGDYNWPKRPSKQRKAVRMLDLDEADVHKDENCGRLTPVGHITFPYNAIDIEQQQIESDLTSSSSEGYSNEAMFLAQAKLYALGDYMISPSLQKIAFERLQSGLVVLELTRWCGVVLSPPVVYIHANTVKPPDREESLGKLVTTFIVENFESLDDEKGIDDLVCDGGDFTADMWNKVKRRVVGGRKSEE